MRAGSRLRLRRRLSSAFVLVSALAAGPAAVPKPLVHAHAHNDYWHGRPLLDALDRGFCSVEADVFLKDGKLLVGHAANELKPGRTLEALYLEPLRERVKANGGRVYPSGPVVYLLVDVKSDAAATYAALGGVLAKYDDMLSVTRDGKFEPKAVTVVVSGNRDQAAIRKQKVRYAGIDGRPADLERDEPADVMPWVSENWNTLFRWKGDGPMPEGERAKLRDYVHKAHEHGRLVRFWATPENEAFWAELLAAKVDLVGTDDLDRLKAYLIGRENEIRRLQDEISRLPRGEARINSPASAPEKKSEPR